MAIFLNLPQDIENLILEYTQDPDSLILMNYGKYTINRSSPKIKEIGGLLLTKFYYPLYHLETLNDITKTLYFHATGHYSISKEHMLIKYNKR